jgi:hypothetical protein
MICFQSRSGNSFWFGSEFREIALRLKEGIFSFLKIQSTNEKQNGK